MDKRKKKILVGTVILILLGTCVCCTVMGLLSADFNLNFEREDPLSYPGEQPSDNQQLQPQSRSPTFETTEINGNTVTVYLTVYQDTIMGTPTLEGRRCQNMNAVRGSLEIFDGNEAMIGLEFLVPETPLPWTLSFEGHELKITPLQASENQNG